MTLWERIVALIEEAHGRTLGAVMESLSTRRQRKDAAIFSIALIALSAKMAKADGIVTDDEVAAFRSFFTYPAEEDSKVRTLYSLAMEDVAGFQSYAKQVSRLYRDEPAVLEDVLDCLFFIALADGVAHPNEMDLLREAADAFGLNAAAWRRIKAGHLGTDHEDPYVILGVEHDMPPEDIRNAYMTLVKANHPDALTARGVPADLVKIAEHRMATINAAYEKIQAETASS